MTATNEDVSELGYTEALAELEAILDRLEHDEPDVDRVAADVERAALLVTQCRGRITSARGQLDGVMSNLDGSDSENSD